MSLIQVEHLTFCYDGSYDNVFEDVSFQLDTDWRLGLTGRNGRGKTTLLMLLQGKYTYRGTIRASVGFDYFPFSVPDSAQNALDILASVCPEVPEWRFRRAACVSRRICSSGMSRSTILTFSHASSWRSFCCNTGQASFSSSTTAFSAKKSPPKPLSSRLDAHGRGIRHTALTWPRLRFIMWLKIGGALMKKTVWLTRTAVCLALLVCLQFITRSLGQLVTGSCVNLVLATAALLSGVWSGVAVAVISPFCAYLLGIGPAFFPLVPCVALGNAVYAALIGALCRKLLADNRIPLFFAAALAAAAAKFLTLYLVLVRLVAPMVVPAAKLSVIAATFTWPQLLTAAIGGVLACLVIPPVKKALEARGA